MTLIAGYLYQNAAHLIADSAETRQDFTPTKQYHKFSSFGELSHTSDDLTCVEAAQKIYNIDNKFLLTFSGKVLEGRGVVEDLTIHHRTHEIRTLLIQYFTNAHLENQYILALCENNRSYLFFYYSKTELGFIEGDTAVMMGGTNAKNIYLSIQANIQHAQERSYTREDTLIQIIATLQFQSLHHQTIQLGVGGYYNGAIISNNGITWAKDTYFFLYSRLHFDKGYKKEIFRYNRDNCTILVEQGGIRIFCADFNTNTFEEFQAKWMENIKFKTRNRSAQYYVLYGFDSQNLVIINNSPHRANRVIPSSKGIEINDEIRSWTNTTYRLHEQGFFVKNNFED
jgi:hypothetical protein